MAKKEQQSTPVIQNRKANHLYFVEETFEVGIMLIGSEVKSIRDGKCSLNEAWVDIDEKKNEIWLVGAHIDEYLFANRFNHFPARRRKLLAHVHEITKMRRNHQDAQGKGTEGLHPGSLEAIFQEPPRQARSGDLSRQGPA